MNYLLIENKGEIDINALILMGGSTKRDSTSAIGFFGSGWKYTIALFLKNGIDFKIFSGEKEVIVTTKDVQFRDKEFKQILINGQETSLTTDMGPQWDSWMGIREIVSNSIDEGEDKIISSIEELKAKEGYTRIYVEHHEDIKAVIDNWDTFFSFDRIDEIINLPNGKVYPQMDTQKESLLLYRKGIQCYHLTAQKALFSYDLPEFKINESRVVSNTYEAKRDVCEFLCKNVTIGIAKKILANAFTGDDGYWEGQMEWHYYGNNKLSNSWREAISDKAIVVNDVSGFFMEVLQERECYRVSKEMARAIKGSFSEIDVYGIGEDNNSEINWKPAERTSKIEYMLKKALEFLKEVKYNITHDIQIVQFDKKSTLGLASKKTILLSIQLFDMGSKELVTTIIEEEEHLVTGFEDESRNMQNHLFRKWVSALEDQYGIFL